MYFGAGLTAGGVREQPESAAKHVISTFTKLPKLDRRAYRLWLAFCVCGVFPVTSCFPGSACDDMSESRTTCLFSQRKCTRWTITGLQSQTSTERESPQSTPHAICVSSRITAFMNRQTRWLAAIVQLTYCTLNSQRRYYAATDSSAQTRNRWLHVPSEPRWGCSNFVRTCWGNRTSGCNER